METTGDSEATAPQPAASEDTTTATPAANTPKTGDASPLAIWLVLAVSTGAVLVYAACAVRKRRAQ